MRVPECIGHDIVAAGPHLSLIISRIGHDNIIPVSCVSRVKLCDCFRVLATESAHPSLRLRAEYVLASILPT